MNVLVSRISLPRALALGLFTAGLVAGALADRVPSDPPPRQDGRFVLAVDLHVHSFLGDGAIAPWNLGREARRRGLDALAITNHNQVFASRFGHWLSGRLAGPFSAALILTGQEVTHPGYHIVAVGLQQAVPWRLKPPAIIAAVHQQGGVAIAAHASRAYWRNYDDATLLALDGIEVAHPQIYRYSQGLAELATLFARGNRVRAGAGLPPLAAIGSSDFHTMAMLGRCRTFVFARELSQAGILEAIKEGRTQAFAEGDPLPPWARAFPVARPRAGGILAWLGLLLLVALAPRRGGPENFSPDNHT